MEVDRLITPVVAAAEVGVTNVNAGVLVAFWSPPTAKVPEAAAAVCVAERISLMIWGWVATGKGISLLLVATVAGAIEAGRSQAVRSIVMVMTANKRV